MQLKSTSSVYAIRCLLKGLALIGRPEIRCYVWGPILANFVSYILRPNFETSTTRQALSQTAKCQSELSEFLSKFDHIHLFHLDKPSR